MTFKSVSRLSSNFEYEKIRGIGGLFPKAVCENKVVNLGEKRLTWARIFCIQNTSISSKKPTQVPENSSSQKGRITENTSLT